MATEDDVRTIALGLPGSIEKPSYGARPSWRTKSKMFCWLREDPDALVVWVDSEEEKLAMIEGEPDKFSTTDHYDGHPIVLVDIEAVDVDELRELIEESWVQRASPTAVNAWLSRSKP